MTDKKPDAKEIDYLHPDGIKKTAPHTEQEKKNEKRAEESTQLAEQLAVDKNE